MKNVKQTVVLLACAVFAAFAFAITPLTPAYAASCDAASQTCCGGVEVSIISCPQTGGDNAPVEETGVWGVLLVAINIMVALVGVAGLGGIIYGAILYTSAGGNMEQTKKGMQIIMNVAVGMIAFALMFVGLNFLVPGGVFTA